MSMTQEPSKPKGKAPLCRCGCGRYVTRSKLSPYGWNKYLHGHNWKKGKLSAKWKPLKGKAPLCKCGCGQRVMRSKHYPYGWNQYILGHNCRGKKLSAETRRKLSDANKGKNNLYWVDGRSYENKPPELTIAYRQAIRRRDNFTCQFCGYKNNGEKRELDVHHIDGDPKRKNNHPDNLITLCRFCHRETRILGDKAAWFRVCGNLVKKSKKLNPKGHRAAVELYEQNMKLFYGKDIKCKNQ